MASAKKPGKAARPAKASRPAGRAKTAKVPKAAKPAKQASAPAAEALGSTLPRTAPGPASVRPAQAPAPSQSSLPRRIFLQLDSRGLDGVGMPIEVITFPCVMGSARRSAVWINAPRIETRHAQVTLVDEGWVLEDLGSEHGTFFEGERITRRVLKHGDTFLLAGYLRLRVEFR